MRRLMKLAAVLLLLVVYIRCNPALSLAPPGSSITLIANPCRIPSSGGVSVISAVVIKTTGVPVADGTVVQFFTNLGHIDAQGKTNDGIAKVNLTSDGRSGTASVLAMSGGAAAPAARASIGGTVRIQTNNVRAEQAATPVSSGGGQCGASATGTDGSSTITVLLGAAGAGKVILTASPAGISVLRPTALLTATVLDGDGNPVPNTAVYFSIEGGKAEILSSRGDAVFTDNNGHAEDIIRTNAGALATEYTITVHASTGPTEGSITMSVNSGLGGATPLPRVTP
jgi:hypothetical protein